MERQQAEALRDRWLVQGERKKRGLKEGKLHFSIGFLKEDLIIHVKQCIKL
jgi:hypothetical protein